MKLSGASAAKYLAKPDPAKAGLLIFGADPMRVAMKRQEAILALIGPEGEAEMRLVRLNGAEARRDSAALSDAMRAQSFFPGPRVAFLEDATDGLAPMLAETLSDWRPGDAVLVVTAGELKGKSALKKLFEDRGDCVAIGFYDDPPTREEIEAELSRAGLSRIAPEAMTDLAALARALDPGDFRQTLEKVALYKWGDETPLSPADVAACAPGTLEADVDEVIHAAAEKRRDAIGILMRRLEGQGVTPVTICIMALRHFRSLHLAASDPGGAEAGLSRMRPPVFGPRREAMARQAKGLGRMQAERALQLLVETDLTLRSSARAPGMALVERALLRIASAR